MLLASKGTSVLQVQNFSKQNSHARTVIKQILITHVPEKTCTDQSHLAVCVERVEHRGRRQEVPGTQIFSSALLKPKLLRFREYSLPVLLTKFRDIFVLSSQRRT